MLGNKWGEREAGATTIPEGRDHLLPSPLWGLVFPVLIARVPLTLICPVASSPPPSTSGHQTVPLLKAYSICPLAHTAGLWALSFPNWSCRHHPAALCVQFCLGPQFCRALLPEALIMSLLRSKAFKGRPLLRESSPSFSCWRSRPFPVWRPPQALPLFCLPTGFSP